MSGRSIVILVIISVIFVGGFVPESFADNANLFVSAENSQFDNFMLGPQVVEVKIIDSDISDINEAKGEPDVTVNGKILRMVQAVDGNWYGYFADRNSALIADSTSPDGITAGLQFGKFCSNADATVLGLGVGGIADSVGVAVPSDDAQGQEGNANGGPITAVCSSAISNVVDNNVVLDAKQVNENIPNFGQIGIDTNAWPFIQLYPLSVGGNVVVQYNKGGGAQTTTLTFELESPPDDGGDGGVTPPKPGPVPSNNSNLFIYTQNPQFPNFIFGPDVIEVIVADSDISDTDEAKGEPNVTVNGKIIRMVQAVDGNWYGYFADRNMAQIADSTTDVDGEGSDFGTFCGKASTILDGQNPVSVSDTVGIAVNSQDGIDGTNPPTNPIPDCNGKITPDSSMNVLGEVKQINPEPDVTKDGQLGMDGAAWPFIQLFQFTNENPVVIQYNKGGGAQTATLTFETEPPASSNNNSGGGDNQWDTRPTSGLNPENGEQKVDNGIGWNGNYMTITHDHYQPFEKEQLKIGERSTLTSKVYAPKGLWMQSFMLGVDGIGSNNAEVELLAILNSDGSVDSIKVIQKTDVVNPETLTVSNQKDYCQEGDKEKLCDKLVFTFTLQEQLQYAIASSQSTDFKRRVGQIWVNEGFEIIGEPINPMLTKMIPSEVKNEGLLKVTQVAKYSPYWVAEDDRMFEMNNFGSFKQINQSFERFQDTGEPRTRMHSGFGGMLQYEQSRALEVFDSTKLISDLPDSFAHHYEFEDRIPGEMKQQMLLQEQTAKDILADMDKQDRDY